MAFKILLVEDEDNLANAILLNLELEGYQTHWLKNGKTAETTLLQKPHFYDLIILDVMIPEKDGLELCLLIRKQGLQTPVLFLSARNSTSDKILGLKSGANDYLGKPFHLEEFLLRVKNLLPKSVAPNNQDTFAFSGNLIDFESYSAKNTTNDSIELTNREVNLLKFFSSNANKVIPREELAEAISNNGDINHRVIDNAIVKFRKFFETNIKQPQHFLTVRGVGYQFKP